MRSNGYWEVRFAKSKKAGEIELGPDHSVL